MLVGSKESVGAVSDGADGVHSVDGIAFGTLCDAGIVQSAESSRAPHPEAGKMDGFASADALSLCQLWRCGGTA